MFPFTLSFKHSRVAENGDMATLKAFIDAGIRPKETFAVLTSFHGRRRLLEYVLDERICPIDALDQYRRTPLMRAIEGNRVEIVT